MAASSGLSERSKVSMAERFEELPVKSKESAHPARPISSVKLNKSLTVANSRRLSSPGADVQRGGL